MSENTLNKASDLLRSANKITTNQTLNKKVGEGRTLVIKDNLPDKLRPTTIKRMFLPSRIKNMFLDETLKMSYLFSGAKGRGKTSLAYILTKDFLVLDLNNTFNRGIEFLQQVEQFCKNPIAANGKLKSVIVDEADKLTPAVQDGLKTLLEHTSVLFIFITNHSHKITKEMKSRIKEISFDYSPQERVEVGEQLSMFYKQIAKDIYNCIFDQSVINYLFSVNVVDIRKSLTDIESFFLSYKPHSNTKYDNENRPIIMDSDISTSILKNNKQNNELYNILTHANTNFEVQQYIRSNYLGSEDECFTQLGIPFFDFLRSKGLMNDYIMVCENVNNYTYQSLSMPDKMISLMALCETLNKLLKGKKF